jgi:hypothetical protein
MSPAAVNYLRTQIVNHGRLFFTESIAKLLQSDTITFLPYNEATAVRGHQIVIPIDIAIPPTPDPVWRVPFNSTELTLWNRLPRPEGNEWRALPNETSPVWYHHQSGTLIPAWNLFGNLFDLLTFGEERRTEKRDHHGRFAYSYSPRLAPGLLAVPAVNEAVALLVDATNAISRSENPTFHLDSLSGPPVVVLSHDCDILAGNDLITQSVRLYRALQPMTTLRMPKPIQLWWVVRNAFTPDRYYFDNATGMADLERVFGATSTYYLLNGTGGRFGARSSLTEIRRLVEQLSPFRDFGIHYNYDTFLDQEKFAPQLDQLQRIVPTKIVSGRAHYLRFDPFRSYSFLTQFGIYADESSGWADFVGYRNGIAGCFQPYDSDRQSPHDIWEIPMSVMELALVTQHGAGAVSFVEKQLHHLGRIGGALTVLFHPGQFFNPEHAATLGTYHEILKLCRQHQAVYLTARQLVDRIRT